jgi:hypothetical protein
MSQREPVEVSKEDAIAAVRAAGWPEMGDSCGHRGCEEHQEPKRWIVHSRAGGFGCDVDVESAVQEIEAGQRCVWVYGLLGHNLVVVGADGRTLAYEIPRPEPTGEVSDGAA